MNKRDFARLLVRMVGVSTIANGLCWFTACLWQQILETIQHGFNTSMLFVLGGAFPSIVVGLFCLFKGSWIADKLVQVDDAEKS